MNLNNSSMLVERKARRDTFGLFEGSAKSLLLAAFSAAPVVTAGAIIEEPVVHSDAVSPDATDRDTIQYLSTPIQRDNGVLPEVATRSALSTFALLSGATLGVIAIVYCAAIMGGGKEGKMVMAAKENSNTSTSNNSSVDAKGSQDQDSSQRSLLLAAFSAAPVDTSGANSDHHTGPNTVIIQKPMDKHDVKSSEGYFSMIQEYLTLDALKAPCAIGLTTLAIVIGAIGCSSIHDTEEKKTPMKTPKKRRSPEKVDTQFPPKHPQTVMENVAPPDHDEVLREYPLYGSANALIEEVKKYAELVVHPPTPEEKMIRGEIRGSQNRRFWDRFWTPKTDGAPAEWIEIKIFGVDPEREWSEQAKQILIHESTHLAQECLGHNIWYMQGKGKDGDASLIWYKKKAQKTCDQGTCLLYGEDAKPLANAVLGYAKDGPVTAVQFLESLYEEQKKTHGVIFGLDDEFEAWAVQNMNTIDDQVKLLQKYCGPKKSTEQMPFDYQDVESKLEKIGYEIFTNPGGSFKDLQGRITR